MSLSFLSTPEFLVRTFHVFTVFAVPIHILGTYCILFKTPKNLKSVKWNMLILQVFSMLSDFALSILMCPFLIFPAFAGQPMGILNELGASVEVQLYLAVTTMLLTSASIISLFENRFCLVFVKTHWWRKARYPFLVAQYLMAIVSFIAPILMVPDQNIALDFVRENYPKLPVTSSTFVLSLGGYCGFLSIFIPACIFSFEAILICKLLFLRLRDALHQTNRSQKTNQLQRKFLIIIVIQVITPTFTMVSPGIYYAFSVTFQIYNQFMNNFCIIVISLHGVISTIMMLVVHEPYRKAVRKVCFSWAYLKK